MEVTKREIIASITIIAVMLIMGVVISEKINEKYIDKKEMYNKAVKIENDKELFQYGMETNIGNAFVYGELKAVDKVSYQEIDGEYMYIEKVKEQYTMHTKKVRHTKRVNGKTKTYYKTETYWTWDRIGSEDKKSKEIYFCGVVFDIEKIEIPKEEYIETIKESSTIRYKYYGVEEKFKGTIFTKLKDETITENSKFYEGSNIKDTVKQLENEGELLLVIFWIVWIALIGGGVYGFCYMENRWLE